MFGSLTAVSVSGALTVVSNPVSGLAR